MLHPFCGVSSSDVKTSFDPKQLTKNQVNISLNRFSRHICISNVGALIIELTLNSKNFLAFKEVDFCI